MCQQRPNHRAEVSSSTEPDALGKDINKGPCRHQEHQTVRDQSGIAHPCPVSYASCLRCLSLSTLWPQRSLSASGC